MANDSNIPPFPAKLDEEYLCREDVFLGIINFYFNRNTNHDAFDNLWDASRVYSKDVDVRDRSLINLFESGAPRSKSKHMVMDGDTPLEYKHLSKPAYYDDALEELFEDEDEIESLGRVLDSMDLDYDDVSHKDTLTLAKLIRLYMLRVDALNNVSHEDWSELIPILGVEED